MQRSWPPGAAAHFMVNCAHPDHFFDVFDGSEWTRRVRGLRCDASRLSHAELDACGEQGKLGA